MQLIKEVITSETFWTGFGSVISACVLWQSAKEIKRQNHRQNQLDKRQKEIDERENYNRETSQVLKIFTEHQSVTPENIRNFDFFETHNNSKPVVLKIHNKSEYPITNVYIIGYWERPIPPSDMELPNLTGCVFVFVDREILPGSQTICFSAPEKNFGSPWPLSFKIIFEDIYRQRWIKNNNKFDKLEEPFETVLYRDYNIKDTPIILNSYWLVDDFKKHSQTYFAKKL